MSDLMTRRRELAPAAAAPSINVIAGTAVTVGTTLTLPIPSDYYFHAYKSSDGTIEEGELREVHRDPYGLFRIKSANGGNERINKNPFISQFWLTQSSTEMTWNCTNKNTSGLLVDGDTWAFVAWKEA